MSRVTVIQPDAFLIERASVIRALGKRMVRDIVEIGRLLAECKGQLGHGAWIPWLQAEFGWTDDTALNFMRAHEMAKSRNFRDLNLPVSAVYLLARPSTPDELRDEVIERAANGEAISHKEVARLIDEARQRNAWQSAGHETRQARTARRDFGRGLEGPAPKREDARSVRHRQSARRIGRGGDARDFAAKAEFSRNREDWRA